MVFIIVSFLPSGSASTVVIGILGAVSAGFGTTCMYAGEGSFFAHTAQLVAKLDGRDLREANSTISSVFGFWYLSIEFVAKIAFFGLREVGVERNIEFVAVFVIAVAATVITWAFVLQVPRQADEGGEEPVVTLRDALQTVVLWRDPRIWLISFLVIAFGMTGALLNGDISNQF